MPNMNKSFEKLLNLIKQHDIIFMLRHKIPDGDALGSQFGLGTWIKLNFPNKKVHFVGLSSEDRLSKIFPKSNDFIEIKNELLKKSMAIVTDTANSARIDQGTMELIDRVETIVKVDHHPNHERYAQDNEVVFPEASSACEIVSLFLKHQSDNYKTNSDIATYLYTGLLTDSGRFMFPSTTVNTYESAIFLLENKANRLKVHKVLYSHPTEEIKLINYIQSNFSNLPGGVAYLILKPEIIEKLNLNFQKAKNFVNCLSAFEDHNFWSLITYDDVESVWRVSLRSRERTINHIAEKFGGGGHKLACATKLKTISEVMTLLNELSEFAINK